MLAHRLASMRRPRRRTSRADGQSMVEFALVFPIFVTLVLGLVEFAFVFNAILSVNYAARDAALAAAEAGDTSGADCVILSAIEDAVGAPTADERIQSVEIYRADPDGDMVGSPSRYVRTGSTTCTFVDGTSRTAPYTSTASGYPVSARCNVLGGCDAVAVGDSVDNIGVRITYTHAWVTPLSNFIGGGPGGLTFDRASVMRMEPIL